MANEIVIRQGFVGLLYADGAFERKLTPGKYKLKRLFDSTVRNVVQVDLREIKNDAENEATRDRLEAERERVRITAEAERERGQISAEAELERARLRREADVEEARALAEHPRLMRLRELQTLAEMARSGGRFAVGLPAGVLGELLRDDAHPEG